jgi:hypothetical protein
MQGQPNLNCKQTEEALDAYYDLELSPEEAEAVELHLADCTACNAKLADIEMVVGQLKSLPAVEWSGDLSDAIEARILAQSEAASGATASSKANPKANPTASSEANLDANPQANPQANNVVALNSRSSARPNAPAGGVKTFYILASAASILALFFAFSQFSSAPTAVNKVAQLPAKVVPVMKETAPVKEVEHYAALDNGRELANANENTNVPSKAIKVTATNSSSKVAVKPDTSAPPKLIKEETTTKKMLANNKQGERDTNNNNVNDSEEIVAVYDYETIDSASDFGINTNEDGLYAIKL